MSEEAIQQRREVYFSGRVQGVGFRYTVRMVASRFAVTGFVKNLPDGRVQLVAEGLTNHEIGRRLSIALGTVKRHIANINDKLNTRTRTQAVTVARSLSILP